MAITAIVAALLFSYRHSVHPDDFHMGDFIGASSQERLRMLAFLLTLFSMFGLAILGTLSRYVRWVALWVMMPAFALLLIWPTEFTRLFGNDSFVVGLAFPLLITIGACFVARQNGYRITRRSLVPDAADELIPAVDPSS